MSLLIKGVTKLSQLTIDVAKNWAAKKISNLGAPAAQNDVIRADASVRAPDSSKLEGSSKATVQDHTPKAHTLASHSAGRIGKDRFEWAANKLLKGAGAGADPTEIDVPAAGKLDVFSGLEANKPATTYMNEGAMFLCLDQPYGYELVAGIWVKKYLPLHYTYDDATLADFQTNPATGTFATAPENVNDDDTATLAIAGVIAQYAEVDFGKIIRINQWRQYGSGSNNGDGSWKIQYLDIDGAWQDWVVGISTRATADWCGMQSEAEVITTKIRLTAVTMDTSGGTSRIGELEVYHS